MLHSTPKLTAGLEMTLVDWIQKEGSTDGYHKSSHEPKTGVNDVIYQVTAEGLKLAFEFVRVISPVARGPCICTANSEVDVAVIAIAGIARRLIDMDVKGASCGSVCG